MKKIFEILLVIILFFTILYSFLYVFYFDSLCDKFSGKDENNLNFAIKKIASCKDSLVCHPNNIKTNDKNEVNNWNCKKKDSPIFGVNLYINIFNHFINSIK